MLCEINMFPWNISYYSHIPSKCEKHQGIFHKIMLVPHNIVMDLNNVTYMEVLEGGKEKGRFVGPHNLAQSNDQVELLDRIET